MRPAGSQLAILTVALAAGLSGPAVAARDDLETRVLRLERVLDSQTLVDMSLRLDQLQNEIQQLRGQLELQQRAIDELRRAQREAAPRHDAVTPPAAATPPPAPPGAAQGGAPVIIHEPAPATPPAPAAPAMGEQEAYQKAFDQLRELRYGPAIDAFRAYLRQYPNGRNAYLAQYWIAEAYYTQREFKQASAEYQRLIDAYPTSPKVAEAMLKLGQGRNELGDLAGAQKVLNELVSRYPNTTEAGQARTLLQKLKR